MALVREEFGLLVLVLVALGLLALGFLELTWPRNRRRRRPTRRVPTPAVVPAPRRAAPVIPPPTVPREDPPAQITSAEALIEQAAYLAEFPLRALVVLRRADEQLGRLSGDRARADALQERLDGQYAEVGCRLFQSGLSEQAVGLLTRVVGRASLRGEDLRPAREALAGALAHIAEQRGQTIRSLAQEGNTAAAIAHGDRLVVLVRAALNAGLTESDLTAAVAATQRVFVHLGVHRVVAAR